MTVLVFQCPGDAKICILEGKSVPSSEQRHFKTLIWLAIYLVFMFIYLALVYNFLRSATEYNQLCGDLPLKL